MLFKTKVTTASLCLLAVTASSRFTTASSHREAPLITESPKVDCTDFYMFNSYEPGREGYVTMIANYIPLQDGYGGPNYFSLDPNAVYEFHIDNTGDGVEDITFQFRFQNQPRNIALAIGPEGNRRTNSVPVLAVGQIGATNIAALNLDQTYTVAMIRGPRRGSAGDLLTDAKTGSSKFTKPIDNIGEKTIPDYGAYANSYIYDVNLPGSTQGRLFVGQRKDPFVVNLGETFDLVNITTSPLGLVDANKDSLFDKNVTSLILEVPKSALLAASDKPIIGAWATASKISNPGVASPSYTQVSRLGHPLVNEVVIGLRDKDKFNASEPKDDGQFADYVTHPTLPAILELLYGSAGVKAPTLFPRADLVAVFLTGVDGLNKNGSVAEMLRLNTSIAAIPGNQQKNLGVLAGDNAGFPNGRRPGDDIVDIALRAVMGVLLSEKDAPSGKLPFTDGAYVDGRMFLEKFPYLNRPIPGSPNDPEVTLTLQKAASVNGPFTSVPATYDPTNKVLRAAGTGGSAGFFRARSANRVTLGEVTIDKANQATVRVATP